MTKADRKLANDAWDNLTKKAKKVGLLQSRTSFCKAELFDLHNIEF